MSALAFLTKNEEGDAQLVASELQPNFNHDRPVLTHLNADTTWLVSYPYPDGALVAPNRKRFNILTDPWLQGSQSDYYAWFSTQTHALKSSVQTISELEGILREAEDVDGTIETAKKPNDDEHQGASVSYVDAVIISHEFTDHCHEATLKELHPSVPIFATTKAAELIRSWNYFKSVHDIDPFEPTTDWRKTSTSPLPPWLGISRLITGSDALYYHSAVIICSQSSSNPDAAEAIIYTPHGVESGSFSTIASAKPPVNTLALLHGLHDISLKKMKQLNLGAHNALKAQRILQSKYWIGTHDEIKHGGGIIGRFFLSRKQITVDQALQQEKSRRSELREAFESEKTAPPRFHDLKSGDSLVLS